jgi:hypothetical protein
MAKKKSKVDVKNQMPVQIELKAVIARLNTENRTDEALPTMTVNLQFPDGEKIKARLILLLPQNTFKEAVEEGDRVKRKLLKHQAAQIILKKR